MPGSGIGRACALRLGVPGCLILALDRDSEAAAHPAVISTTQPATAVAALVRARPHPPVTRS